MELVLLAGAIVNLILLIVFFQRLREISAGTRATLYANLYSQFLQDQKLRNVSQILRSKNEEVAQLILSDSSTLFYYLDFMDFVLSLYLNNAKDLEYLKDLFNSYFEDIKIQPDVVSLIQRSEPLYPNLRTLLK